MIARIFETLWVIAAERDRNLARGRGRGAREQVEIT
jgi:hypothetical protein